MKLNSSLKCESGGQSLMLIAAISCIALIASSGLMMSNQEQLNHMKDFRQKTDINTNLRRIQVSLADPESCTASFSGLTINAELSPSGTKENLYNTLFVDQQSEISSIRLENVTDVTPISPDLKLGTLQVTMKLDNSSSKTKTGTIPMYFRVDANNIIHSCQTTQLSGVDQKTIEDSICEGLMGPDSSNPKSWKVPGECLASILKRIGTPPVAIQTASGV